MRSIFLGFLILLFASQAYSQKLYFIYLQTENVQPFFVRINDVVHSSSANGYLILSNLMDTVYDFRVGFPQNKYGEQDFSVQVKAKDHGYILKNFGEKGWGLFDLLTLSVQMALPAKTSGIQTVPRENISAFTEMLSKASNDPSLKEKTLIPETVNEPVAVQQVTAREVVQKNVGNMPQKEQQLFVEVIVPSIVRKKAASGTQQAIDLHIASYKRSIVNRRSESSTSVGFGLTFIDEYSDGSRDTIAILIPNPRTRESTSKTQVKEERQFLNISSEKNGAVDDTDIVNMGCKSLATENDITRLRRKMNLEKKEEGMIDEAKKAFRDKCFTTMQLKDLSAVFVKEVNKYKLFDVAYSHVADPENYPTLLSELKDEYYVNRFKAMLR